MIEPIFVRFMANPTLFKLMDFLITNKDIGYTKKEIREFGDMPLVFLDGIWDDLLDKEVLLLDICIEDDPEKQELHIVDDRYILNQENVFVKALMEIRDFVEREGLKE